MKGLIEIDNNKIIGFNLSLNFGFTDDEENKEVIIKVENLISDLFQNKQDTGVILLGGNAEFIRENNDKGIRKISEESDD